MDKEEKELQIKLAKLQTDVQTSLAFALAYFAVGGGLLIAVIQIGLTSVAPNLEELRAVGLFVTGLFIVLSSISGVYRLNQMDKYRKEMNKL